MTAIVVIASLAALMCFLWWSLPVHDHIAAEDWMQDEHGHVACTVKHGNGDWGAAFRPAGSSRWFAILKGRVVTEMADHVSETLNRRYDMHRARGHLLFIENQQLKPGVKP